MLQSIDIKYGAILSAILENSWRFLTLSISYVLYKWKNYGVYRVESFIEALYDTRLSLIGDIQIYSGKNKNKFEIDVDRMDDDTDQEKDEAKRLVSYTFNIHVQEKWNV